MEKYEDKFSNNAMCTLLFAEQDYAMECTQSSGLREEPSTTNGQGAGCSYERSL